MKTIVNKIYAPFSTILFCLFMVLILSSCQDPNEMVKQREAKKGGGADSGKQEAPEAGNVAAAKNPSPEKKAPAEKKENKSILNKTTAVVVDAKKAQKNPDISVVDGKIKGHDPFTQAGSAYVSMASKVSTLGMQQAIKLHKATNDRFPNYDEYMKMMKQNKIEFAQLPPYQMYGYDDETGHILVLQDNKKKAELYKAAGIPLD